MLTQWPTARYHPTGNCPQCHTTTHHAEQPAGSARHWHYGTRWGVTIHHDGAVTDQNGYHLGYAVDSRYADVLRHCTACGAHWGERR